MIADYRGPQPKAEFAGLDGDAINGKVELLGAGAGGPQGTDIGVFPNAVTHEAQAALDKAQHASEVMQRYVGSDYRFTPEGEKIVHKALRDTKDVNKQIIEKQKEFSESAKHWEQLIDDQRAYQGNHRAELHPDPEPYYSGTQIKAAQDTVASFDRQIDGEFQKLAQSMNCRISMNNAVRSYKTTMLSFWRV